MKNKIYIIGLLSSLFIITGGILKINHIAGAGWMLFAGTFILCAVFLPSAVISSYKDGGRRKPWLYLAVFIAVFTDFTGGLFKIMHWPGAGIIMTIGILAPIVIFLPVYLYYDSREEEQSQTNFLYIIFLLVYLSVMSALLSLNVSKEILNDSTRLENLVNLENYYQLKNGAVKPDQKIDELRSKTDDLLNYIHSVKVQLVLYKNEENRAAVNSNNEINLNKIINKDSRDATGTIMFGKEEAFLLKKKIEAYRLYLMGLSNTFPIQKGLFTMQLLNTSDINEANENQVTWEQFNFGNLQLIFVIQRLTELENNIILAESEMIENIRQKASV